ncbi:hypothetical protein NFI96_022646 [Prochilodus magdalenae]|nr:hypothetical protein NFI96_022646 [Prochilodus magdalenae]
MAEASISVAHDQFSCPVCLDLLKDPVTINCGHSFCMVCINGCWDQEVQRGVYSCPQCRETFTPRPVLRRNTMLAEVVEKLKETELQAAPPASRNAGPGDVECDFCTGRKLKAIKSCLTCLVSFCETHLKPHYEVPGLKNHPLVEASLQLQEKICSEHNKQIEIYCRTDQSCICYLCTMEEHRGHDTVSAKTERTEKQNQLKEVQRKLQQRIQENQKKQQELKQAVHTIKVRTEHRLTASSVEDSERIFTERSAPLRKSALRGPHPFPSRYQSLIYRGKPVPHQASKNLLPPEADEDHRKYSCLESQSFQSLCVSSGSEDSPSITVHHPLSFDGVRRKIYYCPLTLDPNTTHPNLRLSEKNRVVTYSDTVQRYSDHAERFHGCIQVLCKESVSGRCYWEVEWSSKIGCVFISVSYKGIRRKGGSNDCGFGGNSQSWSLQCSPSSLSFCHNNIETELSGPPSSRIGVYVDHSAGTLSFYSISHTVTLLHTVHTTFTQPLYAGFYVVYGTVRLCDKE